MHSQSNMILDIQEIRLTIPNEHTKFKKKRKKETMKREHGVAQFKVEMTKSFKWYKNISIVLENLMVTCKFFIFKQAILLAKVLP